MKKKTFGSMIAKLRKEKGMTQLELAEKMGVTDKAVSKWERDLSFPDVNTIPKLAEMFNVTTDELLQVKEDANKNITNKKVFEIVNLAFKGVALAMGVAVLVLSFLNQIIADEAMRMLAIGLTCLAIAQLSKKEE